MKKPLAQKSVIESKAANLRKVIERIFKQKADKTSFQKTRHKERPVLLAPQRVRVPLQLQKRKSVSEAIKNYQRQAAVLVLSLKYYYCLAGSFVKFSIEKYGQEKFEKLYKETNRKNSLEQNKSTFEIIYNFSVEQIEKEWGNKLPAH